MRTLGIVGGIAPGSAVDYYRLLIAAYREQRQDGSYPSILINSIDLTRLLELIGANRLEELTEWLVWEVARVEYASPRVCGVVPEERDSAA
jgi:aspartate racemase